MVDPRIYRAGLALVAVAVIVFGFSLTDQPGAARTSLAPPTSTGATAYGTMVSLAGRFPGRAPGSAGDGQLADYIAGRFRADGVFKVSTPSFSADTAAGRRTIENVVATRTGLSSGAIVIVAGRDAGASGATAELSGTAALLGLAHALAGQTQAHSLMLVSTGGSVGAAGATELAASIAPQRVDAVIVLGDLARAHVSQPIVDPWSNAATVAPPLLRQTLGSYVTAQTGLPVGSTNIAGQLAHLAFPLTTTEQGPFGGEGIPAVLLSLSGSHAAARGEQVDPARIDLLQNAVVQAVDALDAGSAVPPPAAYLTLGGKTVPAWAVRLLVLALILPVAGAAVDALARTRRRGHSIVRWLAWVLAGAVPFFVAWAVLLLAGVLAVLPATPPGPVAGGVGFGFAAAAVTAVVVLLIVVSFLALRPICIRAASELGGAERRPESPAGDAAAVGLLIVTCACALALWAIDPFAAALVVPALHLWLWLAQPEVRARRGLAAAFVVLGLLPAVLVAIYYAHSFGLSPFGLAFTGILLVAGGQIGPAIGVLWCLLLGCAAGALVIVLRSAGSPSVADAPVTVRGPVTYAGPGSLGGTESALGQRR
jgi:hypothetical protein